jgi:predicted lipid-binding transport protein (Tim44 family)
MPYGSHGDYHPNSTLQRAIRAHAGMVAFPYRPYSPLPYPARFEAYGGLFNGWQSRQAVTGAATEAATEAASGSGFWTGAAGPLAEVVGGLLGQGITTRTNRKTQESILRAEVEIAVADSNARAQAAAAQAGAAQSDEGGMTGGTVALIAVGLLALGGAGFYIYKKKG